MDNKLKMQTQDIAEENFKKLSELFPNAITETIIEDEDGKTHIKRVINADILRQEISSEVVEGKMERYELLWPGKNEAKITANTPINKTLRLDIDASVGYDGKEKSIDSENIYIEGDNLDALKLLRETYLGKIKMIYIDPPYNTGNDFIYDDNFTINNLEYLENSGQIDEEGNQVVSEKESTGRLHTNWLNMIYPRLSIARDLLRDDGVIFISIDDNEHENMKKICDEIFGEKNHTATFLWTKTSTPSNLSKKYRKTVEFILVYEKRSDNQKYFGSFNENLDAPLFKKSNKKKRTII